VVFVNTFGAGVFFTGHNQKYTAILIAPYYVRKEESAESKAN